MSADTAAPAAPAPAAPATEVSLDLLEGFTARPGDKAVELKECVSLREAKRSALAAGREKNCPVMAWAVDDKFYLVYRKPDSTGRASTPTRGRRDPSPARGRRDPSPARGRRHVDVDALLEENARLKEENARLRAAVAALSGAATRDNARRRDASPARGRSRAQSRGRARTPSRRSAPAQ